MSPERRTKGDGGITQSRPQRVTIHPREAAALDRLLDAYLATEAGGDPGTAELVALRARVRRLEHDHSAYEEE